MADETYNMILTCGNCKHTFNVSFKKGEPVNLHVPCSMCGCVPGTNGVREHSVGPASQKGRKELLME